CADPIQQIFEQYRGAGSSTDKTADCADAGVQAIRHGDNHDQRHRIGGKDQESSVQDRKAGEPIGDSVGNLGGCSGRLSEATELTTFIIFQRWEFAPDPYQIVSLAETVSWSIPDANRGMSTNSPGTGSKVHIKAFAPDRDRTVFTEVHRVWHVII